MTEDASRSPAGPSISVVVCTKNRAATLEACLDSLQASRTPRTTAEVIVVDNGSTDRTAHSVQTRRHDPLPVRYILEERPGLPNARNRGWQAAEHPIVFFVDDDATVDPEAVQALSDAYAAFWDDTSPIVLGARVLADLPNGVTEPEWLSAEYRPYLTQLDLGDEDRVLQDQECLVGAGFSVPGKTLESIGGFNPSLGGYGMDERWIETRVREVGGHLVYCGSVVVFHPIVEDRLRVPWFRTRLYQEGRAWKLMQWELGRLPATRWVTMGVRHTAGLVLHSGLSFAMRLTGRRKKAFSEMCRSAFCLGCLAAHGRILTRTGPARRETE